jgi:hypothetical protein
MKLIASGLFARLPAVLAALIALGLLICAGCNVAQPQNRMETNLHAQEDVRVSQEQGRLRMRSLVDPMCGRIEQSADEIIAGTSDLDIQMAALKWKIDAVPAMREAIFDPDPGTAGLDTLILCDQMADYFETGPGKKELGPASAQAAATCRGMEEYFVAVLASATYSGDVSKVRSFAREWAAQHPIQYSIADRESGLSRVFEREFADETSVGQQIAVVVTTMDDLNRKMGVYSDQLFRQARWEIQRLRLQLIAELRADEAVPLVERAVKSAEQAAAQINALAPSMQRALVVVEGVPKLADSEREATVQAINDELARENQFILAQRVAVTDQLTKERTIALAELNDTMTQQRQQLSIDAEQITERNIDYAVDRVTRRLIVAMAVMAVFLVLGLFLARWILIRKPV